MDKKVVIGITIILLLVVGVIIVVYGGTQIVSPEDNTKKISTAQSVSEGINKNLWGSKSKNELPTLPEGVNEVILGIIFIAGGIMLYKERKKFLTTTS